MSKTPCPFCGSDTEARTNYRHGTMPERSQMACKRKRCGFRGPQVYGEGSRHRAETAFAAWSRIIQESERK